MNLLDFATTPLWLVWETVRDVAAEDGVELAESELIGLAPLAAFLAVADHAGAPARATRSSGASRPPPAFLRLRDFSPMQALELRLEAARAARRTARPVSGGPFRLIHGGRSDEPTPGPPDRRRGRGRDARRRRPDGRRPGRRRPAVGGDVGGPDAPDAPVVACWEGRIAAVGPRADARDARSRPRATRSAGSPGSTPAAAPSRPGLIDPHTHLLFGGSREGELLLRQRGAGYLEILAAGGGILSTVAATRAASADELLAHGRRWLDEMLGHGVTTIEAKSGYGLDLETEIRLLEVAYRLGARRARSRSSRRTSARTPSRPSSGRGPTAPRPTSGRSSRSSCPGVAAHGRARFCDVFCEDGVFARTSRAGSWRPPRATGMASRLHADELAPSGGAELAAELGALSADHLATPSEAGIDALAAAAADGRAGRRDAPAGHDLVPDEGPRRAGPDVHRARHPGRASATDFNPGTSPTASLPLAMTIACVELGLTPDEALAAVTINAARALGLEDEIGSIEPGKSADLVVWRVPTLDPDPVLAGRRPGPDRRSSAAGSSSTGDAERGRGRRRAAQTCLPRDSSRTVVVSAGRLDGGHRQLGLGRRPRRPSRGRTLERLGAVGLVVADRHRHDDPRIELGDERRRLGRRQRAAERDAGDVDRADVGELLLGQQVADVAEVDRVERRRARRRRRPACRASAPWASSR